MKLLTIDCREIGGRPGVMLDDADILDLAAAPSTLNQSQWIPYSVVSILAAGREGLGRVRDLATAARAADREELRASGVVMSLSGTALLPPVRRPGLVLIVEEDGATYLKSPNTAVGNGAEVDLPWVEDARLECSGMLAVVMGRPLYRTGASAAADAIAGYTLLLDISAARAVDWRQYVESQQFPGSGPMGPAIVTKDEFGHPQARNMQLSLNGVVVADGSAYQHDVDVPGRVAQLSQRYSFRPGDVVCFAPAAGAAMEGNRLHPGDTVQLRLAELVTLEIGIGG